MALARALLGRKRRREEGEKGEKGEKGVRKGCEGVSKDEKKVRGCERVRGGGQVLHLDRERGPLLRGREALGHGELQRGGGEVLLLHDAAQRSMRLEQAHNESALSRQKQGINQEALRKRSEGGQEALRKQVTWNMVASMRRVSSSIAAAATAAPLSFRLTRSIIVVAAVA